MNVGLHLVTTGSQTLSEVAAIVKEASLAENDFLHIREKNRTARELAQWVEELSQVIPLHRIIIHDRADVAAATGCAGVQLAWHSLPPDLALRVLRPGQRVGCSAHSLEEAETAEKMGATHLLFGHVYESGSKPGIPPRGVAALRELVRSVSVPVVAIGGITPERVGEVLETGCAGIAVLSGIFQAEHPGRAAREYRSAIRDAKNRV